MKHSTLKILLIMLMSMVGASSFAYDIAVKNADGVTIYYSYINDGKELEVVSNGYYSGNVVIPEDVTYMNRKRKVTSIGNRAFENCGRLTSVSIPNSVTYIREYAFSGCSSLTSVSIPNSVTYIGKWAFENCKKLTSVTIPNSVTSIGEGTFVFCDRLTSVTIPNSVTTIGSDAFYDCKKLTSVTIPNSVTSIGDRTFSGCSSLTSVTIPNSVTYIGERAFHNCNSLTSVTIPNSVTSIGRRAFDGIDMPIVISLIENPFQIKGKINNDRTFSRNTFNNATLYVPVGTIEKYKSTEGWKDFLFIEEGSGPNGSDTPSEKQCAKPTISYKNGKLSFNCETEGATYQYSITSNDIKSGSSNEVQLSFTYFLSVYATKAGYQNSETTTAFIGFQGEPVISDNVANVRAKAVMIQSNGGELNISGADEGTPISVFDASGKMVGSAKASAGTTIISTSLSNGEIGIVKIGDKSIKVLMK